MEDGGQYLRSWAVGSAEAVAGHGLDGEMAEMLEGVAKAGSWATGSCRREAEGAGRRRRPGGGQL